MGGRGRFQTGSYPSKIRRSSRKTGYRRAFVIYRIGGARMPVAGSTQEEASIAAEYPRTYAAFVAMPGGAERLQAVRALERRWQRIAGGEVPGGVLACAHGRL